MKQGYGKTALFLTAMLWGTTFAIGKLAAEVYSASFIIALRFTIASAVLVAVTLPLRTLIDKQYLIHGFWMGITLFLSYLFQVIGLTMDTSPGKSAFLCTTYCVMIPFLHWGVTKRKPKLLHVACVFLCLAGVGVLSSMMHSHEYSATGICALVVMGKMLLISPPYSPLTTMPPK